MTIIAVTCFLVVGAAAASILGRDSVPAAGPAMAMVSAAAQGPVSNREGKTDRLAVVTAALDELIASGALEDATRAAGHDDIGAQLDAVAAGSELDRELNRMKAQLPATAAPPALGAASTRAS